MPALRKSLLKHFPCLSFLSLDFCQNKYLCKICIFTIAINSSCCKYQQFEVQKINFNLAVKFQFEYKIPDISYNRSFPLVPGLGLWHLHLKSFLQVLHNSGRNARGCGISWFNKKRWKCWAFSGPGKILIAAIIRHFPGYAFIREEKFGKYLRNIRLKPARLFYPW